MSDDASTQPVEPVPGPGRVPAVRRPVPVDATVVPPEPPDATGTAVIPYEPPVPPALVASGVGVRERRGWALRGLDVSATRGTVTWVSAPDGLTRDLAALALSGRLVLDEGDVQVADQGAPDALRSGASLRRSVGIGWVPRMRLLEDRARVVEVLRHAYRLAQVEASDDDLRDVLERIGLADLARTAAEDLTAGQKALLGAAAAEAGSPPAVVVPFPAAPAATRALLVAQADAVAGRGSAVVVVTAGDVAPPEGATVVAVPEPV